MSDLQLTKSRQYLLLVIGVFILPVILAKLALEGHWFNYGVTNQGELVRDQQTLADYGLQAEQFKNQWLMLVTLPQQCDELCLNALKTINNAYILLGQEIPRVTPVALFQNEFTAETHQIMHHSKWQTLELPEKAKEKLDHPQLLIVDPLSNIVLSYSLPKDNNKVSQFGKAIITDMKKLLKYSRIG